MLLVLLAINGIEAAHRLAWQRTPIGLDLMRWETIFFVVSQLQMVAALMAAAMAGSWVIAVRENRIHWSRFCFVLAASLASLSSGRNRQKNATFVKIGLAMGWVNHRGLT